MKKEESIQLAVSTYLKLQYPYAIFTAESSGMKLTIGQAVKAKKQRNPVRGLPDLFIIEPRGKFHGLFIELKSVTPFKQNGELKAGDHLKEQQQVIDRLNKKGYFATFSTGVEETIKIIKKYMDWSNL
jgi:hypothetical protein